MALNLLARIWELDRAGFEAINVGLHRDWLDLPVTVVTYLGLGQIQLAVLLLAYWKLVPERTVIVRSIWVGVTAGAIRLLMAEAIGRMRPSNFGFANVIETTTRSPSFPSGHATTSFALAAVFLLAYGDTDRAWVGRALVMLACVIALTRIYLGVHYPTDVIGGALLGVAVAAGFEARSPLGVEKP